MPKYDLIFTETVTLTKTVEAVSLAHAYQIWANRDEANEDFWKDLREESDGVGGVEAIRGPRSWYAYKYMDGEDSELSLTGERIRTKVVDQNEVDDVLVNIPVGHAGTIGQRTSPGAPEFIVVWDEIDGRDAGWSIWDFDEIMKNAVFIAKEEVPIAGHADVDGGVTTEDSDFVYD